ncbi:MAG TPA: hypothetical protein DEW46_15210 [Verrucomicrobia bacterium]|jgi:hypothetical protein|nr:hypothetical protein [Verrucomicrobiota bacterium]
MNWKQHIKSALIAFVLVSIGFELGKTVTQRQLKTGQLQWQSESISPDPTAGTLPQETTAQVVVYYLHGTFRCVTCNTIESMAEQLVQTQFSPQLAEDRLAWKTYNFQKDEAFAKNHGIVASCIMISRFENGREVDFKRLDDVWNLIDKPDEFNQHVGSAIRTALDQS